MEVVLELVHPRFPDLDILYFSFGLSLLSRPLTSMLMDFTNGTIIGSLPPFSGLFQKLDAAAFASTQRSFQKESQMGAGRKDDGRQSAAFGG